MDYLIFWIFKPIGEFIGAVLIFLLLAAFLLLSFFIYLAVETMGWTRDSRNMEKAIIARLEVVGNREIRDLRYDVCQWSNERKRLFDPALKRLVKRGRVVMVGDTVHSA